MTSLLILRAHVAFASASTCLIILTQGIPPPIGCVTSVGRLRLLLNTPMMLLPLLLLLWLLVLLLLLCWLMVYRPCFDVCRW